MQLSMSLERRLDDGIPLRREGLWFVLDLPGDTMSTLAAALASEANSERDVRDKTCICAAHDRPCLRIGREVAEETLPYSS